MTAPIRNDRAWPRRMTTTPPCWLGTSCRVAPYVPVMGRHRAAGQQTQQTDTQAREANR